MLLHQLHRQAAGRTGSTPQASGGVVADASPGPGGVGAPSFPPTFNPQQQSWQVHRPLCHGRSWSSHLHVHRGYSYIVAAPCETNLTSHTCFKSRCCKGCCGRNSPDWCKNYTLADIYLCSWGYCIKCQCEPKYDTSHVLPVILLS